MKVLSICLLAILCTAATSLLPSLHEITTGVWSRISSSFNGLQNKTDHHSSKPATNKQANKNKINHQLSTESKRVKLTCTEPEPEHWLLSLYHTYYNYSNSTQQIADLAPAYQLNAASATAIAAPIHHLFSVEPPLHFQVPISTKSNPNRWKRKRNLNKLN